MVSSAVVLNNHAAYRASHTAGLSLPDRIPAHRRTNCCQHGSALNHLERDRQKITASKAALQLSSVNERLVTHEDMELGTHLQLMFGHTRKGRVAKWYPQFSCQF